MTADNSSIQIGDKVMLVWGCCEKVRRHIGLTFVVQRIDSIYGSCYHRCGVVGQWSCALVDGQEYVPLQWLIKLPPDEKTQRVTNLDEVTA